jgi:hypothetical protein
MSTPDTIRVLSVFPFFRYAVGSTSGRSICLTYYRIKAARAFFDEARRDLPMCGVAIYRRHFFGGLEVIEEHIP